MVKRILKEPRYRHVFKVVGIYLVAAWLLLQVAATMFPALHLPEWTVTFILALLLLGLPVAFVLAWAFDITPTGIQYVGFFTTAGHKTHIHHRPSALAILSIGLFAIVLVLAYLQYPVFNSGFKIARPAPHIEAGMATSVAVLPFQNISSDPANQYFCDGLTEELTSTFSQIHSLHVAARSAAFAYEGKNLDVREIGRRLNVTHVIDGTVRKSGDSLRISAELVDVKTGYALWSMTYDRKMKDIFEVQADIAHSVTSALRLVLTGSQKATLAHKPTDSLNAYDFYVQGISYLHRPESAANYTSAIKLFEHALTLDPDFARAYAGLCRASLAAYGYMRTPVYMKQGESACKRAAQLNADARDVQMALGLLYRYKGEYVAAESEYLKILGQDPASAEAYIALAKTYSAERQSQKAVHAYSKAIALEPGNWIAYNELGRFQLSHGRYSEAVTSYKKVIELTPDNTSALNNLGTTYYLMGDFNKAQQSYKRSLDIEPTRTAYSNTGTMYYYLGKYADAVQMFRKAADAAPDDDRTWGNLADAYRHLDGHHADARKAYEHAAALAENALKLAPGNAEGVAVLAWYYVNLDEPVKASHACNNALAMDPGNIEVLHYAAIVRSALGNKAGAIKALKRAVDMGYSRKLIAADPELQDLRKNSAVQKLLAKGG